MRGLSRWWDAVIHLLYPRRCAGCGEIFEEISREKPLCPICYANWLAAQRGICKSCGRPQNACRCGPLGLSSVDVFVHLAAYEPGVVTEIIWKMKRERRPDLIGFLGGELSGALMAVLRECENYREQCLLTHTPRLSKNVRGFGFDQSALLARETAEHLFLPYSALFCRNTGTTEQKQLTRGARMENAENAYRLRSGAAERIAGRTVVIIDDVITTGSTVGVCAALLKHAGAEYVIAAAVARTKPGKKGAV